MYCVYILLAVGEMEQKVRSARGTTLQCQETPDGTTYRWTKDNIEVAPNLGGINTETLRDNVLRITRMTQELAGTYRCFLDGNGPLNTIKLLIVGRFAYIII